MKDALLTIFDIAAVVAKLLGPGEKGDRFILQWHCGKIQFDFQVKAQTVRCRDLDES
jgi:hypothetical protein